MQFAFDCVGQHGVIIGGTPEDGLHLSYVEFMKDLSGSEVQPTFNPAQLVSMDGWIGEGDSEVQGFCLHVVRGDPERAVLFMVVGSTILAFELTPGWPGPDGYHLAPCASSSLEMEEQVVAVLTSYEYGEGDERKGEVVIGCSKGLVKTISTDYTTWGIEGALDRSTDLAFPAVGVTRLVTRVLGAGKAYLSIVNSEGSAVVVNLPSWEATALQPVNAAFPFGETEFAQWGGKPYVLFASPKRSRQADRQMIRWFQLPDCGHRGSLPCDDVPQYMHKGISSLVDSRLFCASPRGDISCIQLGTKKKSVTHTRRPPPGHVVVALQPCRNVLAVVYEQAHHHPDRSPKRHVSILNTVLPNWPVYWTIPFGLDAERFTEDKDREPRPFGERPEMEGPLTKKRRLAEERLYPQV